jgi:hypothetical protein
MASRLTLARLWETAIGAPLATPFAASPVGASLTNVNRSILLVALAVGMIALAPGALLFFRLTSPIRQLTAAARATSASAWSHVRGMSVGSLLAYAKRRPPTWSQRLQRSGAHRN